MCLSLQNAGVLVDSQDMLSVEVRKMAMTDLDKLYTMCKHTHMHYFPAV